MPALWVVQSSNPQKRFFRKQLIEYVAKINSSLWNDRDSIYDVCTGWPKKNGYFLIFRPHPSNRGQCGNASFSSLEPRCPKPFFFKKSWRLFVHDLKKSVCNCPGFASGYLFPWTSYNLIGFCGLLLQWSCFCWSEIRLRRKTSCPIGWKIRKWWRTIERRKRGIYIIISISSHLCSTTLAHFLSTFLPQVYLQKIMAPFLSRSFSNPWKILRVSAYTTKTKRFENDWAGEAVEAHPWCESKPDNCARERPRLPRNLPLAVGMHGISSFFVCFLGLLNDFWNWKAFVLKKLGGWNQPVQVETSCFRSSDPPEESFFYHKGDSLQSMCGEKNTNL